MWTYCLSVASPLCLAASSHGPEHGDGSGPSRRCSGRPEGRPPQEQRRGAGRSSTHCGRLSAHPVAGALLQTHVVTSAKGAEAQERVTAQAGNGAKRSYTIVTVVAVVIMLINNYFIS